VREVIAVPRNLAWLSAAAAIVLSASAAFAAPAPLPSKVARDPLNRFTISVPSAWSVQTSTAARSPAVTAKAPTLTGGLPDSVYVITMDLIVPVTPQGCLVEADRVMKFGIHDWTTVSEGPAKLGGLPAYSRTYTWKAPTGQMRYSVQTCATIGPKAYMVVGTTADTRSAEQHDLPVLTEIMGTFRPNTANVPSKAPGAQPGDQQR
jgi:hypothetical protein